MPTRSRFPRASTALILIDVLNPFDFSGGRAFARRARRTAERIDRLRARARRAGVPVIFVNDNLGRWRSNVETVLEYCMRPDMPGSDIARILRPEGDDYVVLKSTLSGFYQTPLETMLRAGGIQRVILTGFAADNCVFLTAADAYMRDYRIVVPSDCVGSQSARDHHEAVRRMAKLFGAGVAPSPKVRMSRQG